MQCHLPSLFLLLPTHTNSTPAPDLGAYARHRSRSPRFTHTHPHAHAPRPGHRSLLLLLHTQGIKQENIQGTVPTAQAGSRGKNNTTSLFLPKMKQESSSRALGAGETGLGHEGKMTRLPCGGQVGHPRACTSTPPSRARLRGWPGPARRALDRSWLAYPTCRL